MNTTNRILASMLATVGVMVAMMPQPSFAWGATGHPSAAQVVPLTDVEAGTADPRVDTFGAD